MPFIVMNAFQVPVDKAIQFEKRYRLPLKHLQNVPGLEDFRLLRGKVHNGKILYVAHSIWASKEALEAWKQSEHFMRSRHLGRLPASLILGRPHRVCFETVSLYKPPQEKQCSEIE